MLSCSRLLLRFTAFYFVVTTTVSATADCPLHVQTVLTSQQYEECIGAVQTASFVFTKQNANSVHSNEACESALRSLHAIMPSGPCTTILTTGQRIPLDAKGLHETANFRYSRRLTTDTYKCTMDRSKPFNSSDPDQEFVVRCEKEYVYGTIIVRYVVLAYLVGLCVYACWSGCRERFREIREHRAQRAQDEVCTEKILTEV